MPGFDALASLTSVPARAGITRTTSRLSCSCHHPPRRHGDRPADPTPQTCRATSVPQARESPHGTASVRAARLICPARAGIAPASGNWRWERRDSSRTRGDHPECIVIIFEHGDPSRTRGNSPHGTFAANAYQHSVPRRRESPELLADLPWRLARRSRTRGNHPFHTAKNLPMTHFLPRTRGDRPLPRSGVLRSLLSAPHTRGSPRDAVDREPLLAICLVHAGITRTPAQLRPPAC